MSLKYLFKKYSANVKFIFNIDKNYFYINNLLVVGPLGVIQKNLINNLFWINWNCKKSLGLSFQILWNSLNLKNINYSFIISKKYVNIFLKDFEKLIIGVLYGWYISFNIFGRGFSFRLIKRNCRNYLKLKIGYSHFVYYELPSMVWIKISKKKNKLFVFCLDFWILQRIAIQIRALRSKHVYKVQGITYLGEVIKVKPGKQKQT